MFGLESIVETNACILLKLPVAVVSITLNTVVETWIEKELCRDKLVEFQDESVFSFQFGTVVSGVTVQA